jgi:hypothetical protein
VNTKSPPEAVNVSAFDSARGAKGLFSLFFASFRVYNLIIMCTPAVSSDADACYFFFRDLSPVKTLTVWGL